MAGSRSDQIPVHAVHAAVEAASELAANGTSTGSSGGRGCMKTQQTNPRETLPKGVELVFLELT